MKLMSNASFWKKVEEEAEFYKIQLEGFHKVRDDMQAEIDSLKTEVKRLHDRNIQLSIWRKQIELEAAVLGLRAELKPAVKEHWVLKKAR